MAKHSTIIVVGGALATYLIIVFSVLALPANIPQSNITLVIYGTITLIVFLTGYFLVYYGWYNCRHRVNKEPSAIGEAISRSAQLKKVTDKLDIHYRGIIDRMDQTWDYQPSDREQIFTKGDATHRPKGLEQDKRHLERFENAWNLYSNGHLLYEEYKQADEQERDKIRNELINAVPTLSRRLQETLTSLIIEKTEYLTRTISYPPSFEARAGKVQGRPMIFIDSAMLDVLDEPDPWTLEKAQQLASIMTKMSYRPDIVYVVAKRKDALAAISKNRNEFLSAKDEIVRKARSVDCHLRELADEGECGDCKPLKDNLKSLGA